MNCYRDTAQWLKITPKKKTKILYNNNNYNFDNFLCIIGFYGYDINKTL